MFRRFAYLGTGILTILLCVGSPGQAEAQRFRGSPMMRPHMGMNNGFMMNNNRFRSSFGFDSRFRTGAFDPRFGPGRFDRFEDRFENRFGRGRFDRFEDRFENRFGRGFGFTPGFSSGFFNGRVSDASRGIFISPFTTSLFTTGFSGGFFNPFSGFVP